MPELPEVETIARTLSPRVVGRVITDCTVLLPKSLQCGHSLLPMLRGGSIQNVSRRAKLLLVTVAPQAANTLEQNSATGKSAGPAPGCRPEANTLTLAFHLKMTGSFFVHPSGTAPLKHTRIIFDLDDGRLFFDDTRTFGYCRIMLPHELESWDFMTSLGPEPLQGTSNDLAEHLARIFAGRKTAVKALLLDQRAVAGIGNIYADESLFKAGIKPDAKASTLNPEQVLRLATALQGILELSIRECGSSIRDYRDANGNAGAFQNSFAVYGRKNSPCTQCATPLITTRVAGRSTVYCPRCQR